MPIDTQVTEVEREIFERELDSFVPDRMLDAHAHMWLSIPAEQVSHAYPAREFLPWFTEDLTLSEYRRHMDAMIPGRTFGGIILVFPPGVHGQYPATEERVGQLAEHLAKEVGDDPLCRSTIFASPKVDPDFVRQEVQRLNIGGLKCYQTESPREQWKESEIPEFLPEEYVRIADDLGLFLTLHMAKSRGISDPSNQEWIQTHCKKYPNMKLILAHAGSSFNPVWAMEGIESLKGIPNVYCDMGAVGEVGSAEAIIEHLGHDRLLWATDFPISHWRGNYVAFGDQMAWIGPGSYTGDKEDMFILHGLEQLRVIKQAAFHQRLSDSQVEDIFFNNLAGVLGVTA